MRRVPNFRRTLAGANAVRRFAHRSDCPRVLITGAASGGGYACAEAFADRGAELILCDWDGIALTRAAKQLGAFSRFCDAGAERGVEIFVEEISERFGSVDVLVNAAGRGYVRALTMLRMSRAVMPLLRRASGYRLIANIAPAGGFSSRETIFPYAGSFASFARLSETLIDQCRGTEIDVACITPRIVRAKQGSAQWSDHLYRLDRVDEREAAESIVDMVAAERPLWQPQRLHTNRRA
jgi:NADP-dependent 3-hydroxy acid dehydrogenase YdfG